MSAINDAWDDEEVDTSGLDASGWRPKDITTPNGMTAEYHIMNNFRILAVFMNKDVRDACLLAIQSLPKVTAERDMHKRSSDAFYGEMNAQSAARIRALDERDALSARVREMTDVLRDLLGAADHRKVGETFPGPVSRARALIGKEPSK